MVRQDGEVSDLQHVAEVPHGLVDCQELPVVGAVLFVVPGSASWRRWRGAARRLELTVEGRHPWRWLKRL